MIRYLIGDATAPVGDGPKIIAHICNDVGAWGAGFVLALSRRWSAPEAGYRNMLHRPLGRLQFVPVTNSIVVANMIAQSGLDVIHCQPPIRYDALDTCLRKVGDEAHRLDASVHMPRIGCGLAGGRWDEIEPIIQRTLQGVDVFVYDLVAP